MILFGDVSDTVQIATMVCALITGIVASIGVPLMVAWIARMSKKAELQAEVLKRQADVLAAVDKKVDHVTLLANSMKDALVVAEKKASKGEGKEEERSEQKGREAERAKGAADAKVGVQITQTNGDHTQAGPPAAPVAVEKVSPAVLDQISAGVIKKAADAITDSKPAGSP